MKQWIEDNGFKLKTSIDYDRDRYGDGNASVTSILKLIVDPKFDLVLTKYKKEVEQAAAQGTIVHKEAEDFFTKGSGVNTINKNFMIFHTLYDIEVVSQEETIIKEGVRGSIDCIGLKEQRLRNIDYKNSQVHSLKYCLQMGGYQWLNGNPGILVYGKGKLKVIEVEEFYMDLFVELKDYFFKLLYENIG